MRVVRYLAIIICVMVSLSSCGQKGPLYLPKDHPVQAPAHE